METTDAMSSPDAVFAFLLLVAIVGVIVYHIYIWYKREKATHHEERASNDSADESLRNVTYMFESRNPPSLPPRRYSQTRVARPRATVDTVAPRPLPARRQTSHLTPQPASQVSRLMPQLVRQTSRPATAQQSSTNLGYRGLHPDQFPCCPYDKLRNRGRDQVIFWDSHDSCYYCSRGHRFRTNGRIL